MDNPRPRHRLQFWFALRICEELDLRWLGSREVPEAWVQWSDLQSLQREVRDRYGADFTDDETRLAFQEAMVVFYEDYPEAAEIWSNASTRRTSESVTDTVDNIVDDIVDIVIGIVNPAPHN